MKAPQRDSQLIQSIFKQYDLNQVSLPHMHQHQTTITEGDDRNVKFLNFQRRKATEYDKNVTDKKAQI